jgi:hypothetical protein
MGVPPTGGSAWPLGFLGRHMPPHRLLRGSDRGTMPRLHVSNSFASPDPAALAVLPDLTGSHRAGLES